MQVRFDSAAHLLRCAVPCYAVLRCAAPATQSCICGWRRTRLQAAGAVIHGCSPTRTSQLLPTPPNMPPAVSVYIDVKPAAEGSAALDLAAVLASQVGRQTCRQRCICPSLQRCLVL